jgi:hypothetical protein
MASRSRTVQYSSILEVTFVIFLLDFFFVLYEESHGLNLGNTYSPFPLDWLPLIGVVVLSLTTWYEAYFRIFPRRGIEVDPLGRLRLARAVILSLTLFVIVLYVPALVRSNWFWAGIAGAGRSFIQMRGLGNSLLNGFAPLFTFDPVWQYASSQVLASIVMVFGAWVFARTVRRVRK